MAASDRLLTIEVPEVNALPDTPPRRPNVVGIADYLLTMLLRHEFGSLRADFREDGGKWYVRGWTREVSRPEELVAVTEGFLFRAVLARFGGHYMGGQVYGGYTEGRLTQRGRTHGFAMYMANDAWRGFWLKAYASAWVLGGSGSADGEAPTNHSSA
jgi:hypothetical protein